MLKNFKLVLLRNQKFLLIFFIVVFLPSVLLAYFGIRSLQNERYKLQQQTLERQRAFARSMRTGVAALIEKNVTVMRELCRTPAMSARDYGAIRDWISRRLREGSLLGQVAFWNATGPPWLPDWQPQPPVPIAFKVPAQWRNWDPELAGAESAEFRARDYSYAVTIYERLLGAAKDPLVKAWLLGRVARCEVKGGNLDRAITVYRRIAADYHSLPTESGRPLEIGCRLEVLAALASLKKSDVLAVESLEAYKELARNRWSLDGDQVKAYTAVLDAIVDRVISHHCAPDPGAYRVAVDHARGTLNEKLRNWRLAKEVRRSILSEFSKTSEPSDLGYLPPRKRTLVFEGQDVLALAAPLGPDVPGGPAGFLGSLLLVDDLRPALEALVCENRQPDASLRIRSVLSDKVVFATAGATALGTPIVTEFFPENFPPWRLETFRSDGDGEGDPPYQNIFFWTILALLFTLLFGSGLIVRTIVHEVKLLNLKSDFIASVSHEFKTPLTSMGAILEHLLEGKTQDPKRARDYYGILQHDSNRLKRLVENVLDFSKIEEGKKTYRLKPTDPVELVKREVHSFERETGIEGFTLGLQSDDHIPQVALDEEAIGQALHNVLDNAVKFSPGEKQIDVEIRKTGDAVEISVKDCGIGIPEDEIKRIFEKFYRGRQAVSVAPTGTGLGLALVKHIMDAHHGDVIIRSRPGEGSRVSLVLPVDEGIR